MPDQEQAKGLSLNPSGDDPKPDDPATEPVAPPAPTTAGPVADPSSGAVRPSPTINPAPVPSGKTRLAVPYPHDEFIPGEGLPVVTTFGIDVDQGQVAPIKSAAEASGLVLTEVRS